MNRLTQCAALASLILVSSLRAALPPRQTIPGNVTAVDGVRYSLPAANARATVLFFIAHDCPISNSYAPEFNRIVAAYSGRGVVFFVIYAEPDFTPEAARKHGKDYGFRCPAIVRDTLPLAHAVGATVTPEVVEILPGGHIAYRGRIDDKVVSYGVTRPAATEHDLRDALAAALAGRPAPHPSTPIVGCYIAP